MAKFSNYLSLGLLSAGLLGSSLSTFAAANPASELPNSAVYFQLNTTASHPFKGQLKDLLEKNSVDQNLLLIEKLFAANIESTTIGFSQDFNKSTGKNIFMLSFAINQSDFTTIINNASSTELKTENLGLNRLIYTIGDDFFFTYKDGNLVASNQEALIHDLLFTKNADSLSKNTDYQNFVSKINSDAFLTTYIDYNKLANTAPEISSWISSEGFGLSQSSTGFNGKVYIHFQPTAKIDGSKYNFVPNLYTKVNPAGLVYFQETNNLSGHLHDFAAASNNSSKTSDILDEVRTGFEKSTGLNVETDIAPLFAGRTALIVHRDANSFTHWPALTVLSEVKGRENQAITSLDAIFNSLKTEVESDGSNSTATLSTVKWNNSDLKQLKLTSKTAGYYNEEDGTTATDTVEVTITYGVTADGLLLITTLPTDTALYASNGLTNDTIWKKAYTSEQVDDVTLLNFINLKAIIDDFPRSVISDGVDKFFAPLHYLTSSSTGSLNSYWANFNVDLDISKLSVYQDLFSGVFDQIFKSGSDFEEQMGNTVNGSESTESPFTDVHNSDWFNHYVLYMNNNDIMNGYGSEFKPNQSITRAEFIKALIEYLKLTGYNLKEAKYPTNFTDVDGSSWYSAYINTARSNGFIKGYADGSVHPNAPISRAEAMQVLVNADPSTYVLDPKGVRPFHDVSNSDWFYKAVYSAFDQGTINGKTTNSFAPNANLTRAEAAKIINNFPSFLDKN